MSVRGAVSGVAVATGYAVADVCAFCAAAVSQWTFYNASAFNQPLNSWDVAKVTRLQVRGVALCGALAL